MENGEIEEFIDIRRKVGNRIIRAYLLDPIIKEQKIATVKASLRGPKDEFKDFDKYIILNAMRDGRQFRILAETGVYENLRVVGTDSADLAAKSPDELERHFTDALKDPTAWNTSITISSGNKVCPK